jgi:hypothetical protein
MRVKIRFIAEVTQPAMFVDLRWLPRPGETVEVAYRKRIEVVEVVRIDNDKRCDAIVRGKLLEPKRRTEVVTAGPQTTVAADSVLGAKSIEELMAMYRARAESAATA